MYLVFAVDLLYYRSWVLSLIALVLGFFPFSVSDELVSLSRPMAYPGSCYCKGRTLLYGLLCPM